MIVYNIFRCFEWVLLGAGGFFDGEMGCGAEEGVGCGGISGSFFLSSMQVGCSGLTTSGFFPIGMGYDVVRL